MPSLPPSEGSFIADVEHRQPQSPPTSPLPGAVRRASIAVGQAGTAAAGAVKRSTIVVGQEAIVTGTDLLDCWHSNLSPGKCHIIEVDKSCQVVARTRLDRVHTIRSSVGSSGLAIEGQRFPAFPEYVILEMTVELNETEMDKVAEFRLCLEMLRDCLDSYWDDHGEKKTVLGIDAHHDAMILNPPAETAHSANDILLRILELGLWRKLKPDDPQLHSFASPKDFQQSFSSSGLQLNEFLEAVLGELSRWQLGPCQEEEAAWKDWQLKYDQVLLHLHRIALEQENLGMCGSLCARGGARSCAVFQERKITPSSKLCCNGYFTSWLSKNGKSSSPGVAGNAVLDANDERSSITTQLSALQHRRKLSKEKRNL